MIKLREEELKLIYRKKRGILVKDSGTYYFKEAFEDGIELIVERLAKLVGIKCAHYEFLNIKGKRFYLSQMIANEDKFYTLEDLDFNERNLTELRNSLNTFYPKYVDYIMEQIIKIYLFDIIILNPDRRGANIGIYYQKDERPDIYIFDNEEAFYKGSSTYYVARDVIIPLLARNFLFNTKVVSNSNVEDLLFFIKEYGEEYFELFKKMLEILTPDVVSDIISSIEKEEKREFYMKEVYLETYVSNYNKICEVLENNLGKTI